MMYLGEGFKPEPAERAHNFFKQKSAAGSSKGFTHVPLPPETEMRSPATLQMLDSILRNYPFLAGTEPTTVDKIAYKSFTDENPSYWKYRSLCQWYHRMHAMTSEEQASLPTALGVLAPQPAPLTKMDRWILSRLSAAVKAANNGFSSYNFPQTTTALYNFWLYELCDVYLEYLKPIFQGNDPRAILTARNILYTCLDGGLRLISPMMPFISEELYQRLPRRSPESDPSSIMITKYPEVKEFPYRDEKVEQEVELAQKIIGTVRSTRSDYNLPNKTKTDLYLRVFDDKLLKGLDEYRGVIATLAYASNIDISNNPPTKGCAIVTVSDKCSAHLVLKGLIDPEKEVEKLKKKVAFLEGSHEKLKAAAKADGYEVKVPAEIREANSKKMEEARTEIQRLADAIDALKAI